MSKTSEKKLLLNNKALLLQNSPKLMDKIKGDKMERPILEQHQSLVKPSASQKSGLGR